MCHVEDEARAGDVGGESGEGPSGGQGAVHRGRVLKHQLIHVRRRRSESVPGAERVGGKWMWRSYAIPWTLA